MQNGVDGELALQSDVTTAVTGLASEQYVQNYVAANAGGGTIPVASSPDIVLSGVTESAISVTGVENGQVIVAFLSDTSTSNMSTFIQIWDQANWAGFNPSSTQLSSTSSAAIKWVNTTGVTKDVYVRAQLTTTSSVGRVLIMKFAEDFAGDYNDLTNTPTIPTDVSQLTDTTNVIPSDVGDLTDNGGLLGGGGGLGNVIDFGFLGTAYGGTSTTRDFNTPVVVAPGQTVTGWSSYQLAPAVAWRDNYQGTPNTLGTTTYTNSTGSNVTVYARANTSNSNNVGVHYMLLG